MAVGVIAGCAVAAQKFHLGLPGHIALIWMTPVIAARLLSKNKAGTTAGALSAAITTLMLSRPFSGGALGLPLIAIAGIALDSAIGYVEKTNPSKLKSLAIIALAAMAANLICLCKRVLLPVGINAHVATQAAYIWFQPVSYAIFGLSSGVIAMFTAGVISRVAKKGK